MVKAAVGMGVIIGLVAGFNYVLYFADQTPEQAELATRVSAALQPAAPFSPSEVMDSLHVSNCVHGYQVDANGKVMLDTKTGTKIPCS